MARIKQKVQHVTFLKNAKTWDAEERLKTAGNGSFSNAYAYNGLDQRTDKADSGGTFSYLRAGDGIASPVLSDGAATYNYGAGLVSEVRGGSSKFYQSDALGSTRELTNSSGSVTDAHETDAFGNTIAASGSSATPFGFAGQAGYQSDSDTGLKLLGHRYYDSSTGRFLSRDPIRDGNNWYAYCGNDPVNRLDSTGLFYWTWGAIRLLMGIGGPAGLIAAGIAAAAVVAEEAYANHVDQGLPAPDPSEIPRSPNGPKVKINIGGEADPSVPNDVINVQPDRNSRDTKSSTHPGKTFGDLEDEGHKFMYVPDMSHLPFDDGSVEAVYSNNVPVNTPPGYLGNTAQTDDIRRVLVPGGPWWHNGELQE